MKENTKLRKIAFVDDHLPLARTRREMVWRNVAQLYMRSFERSRLDEAALSRKSLVAKTLDQRPRELPQAWQPSSK